MVLRIQILSDLHLEFSWDTARQFIGMLDPEGVDVLVLAGDICLDRQLFSALGMICRRYADSDVVFVHGNHEFYGSSRLSVIRDTHEALRANSNLHWLNSTAEVIRDQRFIGAPLWFADRPDNEQFKPYLNDFHVIEGLEEWVYHENARADAFIRNNVTPSDIVVTHHLPSPRSIAPRFGVDGLNRFFMHDMHDVIVTKGPKLWVHGHTHDSFDYVIQHSTSANTRVVCNPRGYWPSDLNPDFDINKVVVA